MAWIWNRILPEAMRAETTPSARIDGAMSRARSSRMAQGSHSPSSRPGPSSKLRLAGLQVLLRMLAPA
jgi:hypothetical protein